MTSRRAQDTAFSRTIVTAICLLFVMSLMVPILAAQTAQRPRILGISHIAIFAHDYEKSRAYYQQLLGFEEPFTVPALDGTPRMTVYKVNDHQYIELLAERAPNTDRLDNIAVETDDIEGMRLYLASRGVAVPQQLHPGRLGNISFDVIDPAGHTVEMTQAMPTGKTVQAGGKIMNASQVSSHMTHVGVVVTALAPEYAFYAGILGFHETWRGSSSAKTLSWIHMQVPDGTDYVEFMLSKDEPSPTNRGSQHHLCLVVPSVDQSVAMIQSRTAFQMYRRPLDVHVGINRKRIANFFDPDGTRTELMEPDTIDGKPTLPSATMPPGL